VDVGDSQWLAGGGDLPGEVNGQPDLKALDVLGWEPHTHIRSLAELRSDRDRMRETRSGTSNGAASVDRERQP
jgi:hypothetical protein